MEHRSNENKAENKETKNMINKETGMNGRTESDDRKSILYEIKLMKLFIRAKLNRGELFAI